MEQEENEKGGASPARPPNPNRRASREPPTRHRDTLGDPYDRVTARRCHDRSGPAGLKCHRRKGHRTHSRLEPNVHEAPAPRGGWWRWT